jgi:hypothetical protein
MSSSRARAYTRLQASLAAQRYPLDALQVERMMSAADVFLYARTAREQAMTVAVNDMRDLVVDLLTHRPLYEVQPLFDQLEAVAPADLGAERAVAA